MRDETLYNLAAVADPDDVVPVDLGDFVERGPLRLDGMEILVQEKGAMF